METKKKTEDQDEMLLLSCLSLIQTWSPQIHTEETSRARKKRDTRKSKLSWSCWGCMHLEQQWRAVGRQKKDLSTEQEN